MANWSSNYDRVVACTPNINVFIILFYYKFLYYFILLQIIINLAAAALACRECPDVHRSEHDRLWLAPPLDLEKNNRKIKIRQQQLAR